MATRRVLQGDAGIRLDWSLGENLKNQQGRTKIQIFFSWDSVRGLKLHSNIFSKPPFVENL
jgi:hypothetical protein